MMNFKSTLKQIGKSYAVVAGMVGVSPAVISQIANHGIWPKKNKEQLRQNLIEFIKDSGADIPNDLSQTSEAAPDPTQESKDDNMLLRKTALTQATKSAFNLARDPFSEEINNAEDLFTSPDIKYVREAMFQTASHGGFIAVIGESGAGKSTLREDLQDRIIRDGQSIIMIEPYVLAMEDNDIKGKTLKSVHIAEAILDSIARGINPKKSAKTGNKHVLVIEEAHGMPLPTLKHLKRFFELKQGFERLLSIILIGQPELKNKLSENNPVVREVVQRCEVVTLQPLSEGKLEQYLKFKFSRIGKNYQDVITNDAIDAIAERLQHKSRTRQGIESTSLLYPLAVNNLVSAAMNQVVELGFEKVDADIIRSI